MALSPEAAAYYEDQFQKQKPITDLEQQRAKLTAVQTDLRNQQGAAIAAAEAVFSQAANDAKNDKGFGDAAIQVISDQIAAIDQQIQDLLKAQQ